MFKIKYPFAKLPLFQAFLDYVNEFKTSIDTLTLVDIQNLMVNPDGELYAYLRAFSDEIIDFDNYNDFKKPFDQELTALTENILECETTSEARTLLSDSLSDLISTVEEYVAEYRQEGIEVAIEKMMKLKTFSELNVAPFFPVETIFKELIQFGFLENVVLGGLLHLPVSFIETINSSTYPSISGANTVTDGCVELDIVKLIQYAIQNQEFTLE